MTQTGPVREVNPDHRVAELARLQEWVPTGFALRLGSRMLALMGWLDAQFVALATTAGAEEMPVPHLIERSVLERAGYFESFPAGFVPHQTQGRCLSPATCYHCYAKLATVSLPEPGIWTCVARCERNEKTEELGRLRTFMMREIVLAGSAAWLRQQRQQWMDRILGFARFLQMEATLRPATDPFFATGAARGMMLLQRIKQLKYELRAPVDQRGGELSIASFNLHEEFFSRRFGFRVNYEMPTHSACIAFGLERWALALVLQLGPERAFKLIEQEQQ
jgi:seryl-tRNA synthetase